MTVVIVVWFFYKNIEVLHLKLSVKYDTIKQVRGRPHQHLSFLFRYKKIKMDLLRHGHQQRPMDPIDSNGVRDVTDPARHSIFVLLFRLETQLFSHVKASCNSNQSRKWSPNT